MEESMHVVASTALVAPITALEFMGEDYLLTGGLSTKFYLMEPV